MTTIHKKFENWFAKLAEIVYDRKYIAFALMFFMTLGLASQIPKITIDTRDESFFHKNDPALITYNKFRDTFGQDDTFIIALQPKDGLNKEFFTLLYNVHNSLESSVPYIDEIKSLVNGRIMRADADTLYVEELMQDPPRTEADLQRILNLIDHYPLYESLLISKDKSIVSILIKAQAVKDMQQEDILAGFADEAPPQVDDSKKYLSNAESIEITRAIHSVIEKYQGHGAGIFFSGTPAVIAELQMSIEHDLRLMIPLSFLLIVFFLLVLFRRFSGVIYPLIVVFLSLFASLGIMAIFKIPITMVTQIFPSFLLIVGIADSVHILTIFYREYQKQNDKRRAIVKALGFAGLPVLMTSLTTACGILSFVWADVASVVQLGYVAPAGVMLAFVYTVILLPALIGIFPVKQKNIRAASLLSFSDRTFDAIARITTHRPLLVSIISAVLVVVASMAALSVKFSHNALTWFPENSPIRVATSKLDATNGGTVMLEVLIDTKTENGLQDPELLKKIDQATKAIPGMVVHNIKAAKAWSLADVVKETNRALNGDNEDAYVVPDNEKLIAQELLLFESSGSDDLENFTDSIYRTGRLSILAPFTDAILYKDYVDHVKSYLQKLLPEANITLTGKIPLFVQMIKNVVTSMAKSYVFALVVITFLMILMVGRVRVGLLSMVANVAPILGILGLMGIKNIPLDLSTILIGSLILGLVVDDTIHFLHHFRRAFEETGAVEKAVRMTLHTTGRAMVITSMVLCGGFFIYTAAYLESNVRYGLLSGFAVLFALAADFFLVPSLLTFVCGRNRYSKQE